MKVAIAQIKPIKGDIEANILQHQKFIHSAIELGAEMIIFPELSLTGYEPTLAQDLAIQENDERLAVFQTISTEHHIIIGVGLPIRSEYGIQISMLFYYPDRDAQIYSKQYLHPDEEPFFVAGKQTDGIINEQPKTAIAICYEISISEHIAKAAQNGVRVYIASVAKSINGIEKANIRLADIAKKHSMTVMMTNCIGLADGDECAGNSAIWNIKGELVAQLSIREEGILVMDSEAQQVSSMFF